MENLIEILNYVGPLIGVFIGWLLARKNEADKIKYSEIRQVKRSLFILLEIRNQLVIPSKSDRYINILIEKWNFKFRNLSFEKITSDVLKKFIKQILPSLIGDNFQKDLKDQLKKCIDNLSEIDPLLAYRINGKQNIQDYIQSWENESKNYFKFESIEEVQRSIDLLKPKLVEEIKTDIEAIIIDIAGLISDREVNRVKKIITEPKKIEIEKDVDNYLEKTILPPNPKTEKQKD